MGEYLRLNSRAITSIKNGITPHSKSGGGNYHFRGSQDKGKTLMMVHFYRLLISLYGYLPSEAVGNLTITGGIGIEKGYQVLKGEKLHQYLWDLTHKPLRHKIVFIDEIDSEFPARFFQSREQTEIALRMWHSKKLHNYILFSSHLGRGSDLIFDLSANFEIIPHGVNWDNGTIDATVINGLDLTTTIWQASDIFTTMHIYDREETTEHTEEDSKKLRPKSKKTLASERVVRDGNAKLKQAILKNQAQSQKGD